MPKRLTDKNRLSMVYPELAEEWDSGQNSPLTSAEISFGSTKKVWWKCLVCGHGWLASVYNRKRGTGCPACNGNRLTDRNRLSLTNPELCKEWDFEKNLGVWKNGPKHPRTPEEVSKSSAKRVWWKCLVCGHSWVTAVCNRTDKKDPNGCPGCSGRAVTDKNRLSLILPELCKEWDYEKNFPLTPDDVSCGMGIKVGWICRARGHKWSTMVVCRTSGTGCPECANKILADTQRNRNVSTNNFLAKHSDVAKEWDYTANSRLPEEVSCGSNYCAGWVCLVCGNKWNTRVNKRTAGSGCPRCNIQRQINLASIKNPLISQYPEVAAEWDYDRNFPHRPENFSSKSHKRFRWACLVCGHGWDSIISNRTQGCGCPACAGSIVTDKNRLSALYPCLAEEWDYKKNFQLKPEDVSYASDIKAFWVCKCAYSWCAPIKDRTSGKGCSACSGNVVSDKNRLSLTNPELCEEWDFEENFPLRPEGVSFGSGKKVGWICKVCVHKWAAVINKRSFGQGCPLCAKSPVSKVSQKWLEGLSISYENREKILNCGDKKFRVDGFDPNTNTAYEFLGDYWHGNPNKFDADEVHPRCKKTYGQLFDETIERLFLLRRSGYNLEVIWEEDFTKQQSAYF